MPRFCNNIKLNQHIARHSKGSADKTIEHVVDVGFGNDMMDHKEDGAPHDSFPPRRPPACAVKIGRAHV